ncbi:lysophosphatidylserine lipase ABHD12 [Aphomia sociella]
MGDSRQGFYFPGQAYIQIFYIVIRTILLTGASLTASLFVVQVAVLPLLFKYSKSVQRKMVFSTCINYPRNLDYENPSSCDIVGGRNFNIEFQSKADVCPIKLGVWHIIPCSMFKDVFVIRDYVTVDVRLHHELRKTRNTVVLYCHGNSNHRASPHRLQMYKVFQKSNFHVITFDYRGYGDSTRVRPTERGVVEDAFSVYSWLMESLDPENKPTVLLWGHSLGTAVVSNMVAHMSELCRELGKEYLSQPDAIVLEAPFNNLMEEIERHPFSKFVSWLPYYKDTFVKPFTASSEYAFTTDQYLVTVPDIPILMLHSKADKIVPYELAVKLHDTVAQSRAPGAAPLVFHSFERGLGLGHNNLCEAPDLQLIISHFLQQIKTRKE